jgi:hypothetical protein
MKSCLYRCLFSEGMSTQLLLVCSRMGATAVSLTNAGTGLMFSTLLPGTVQSERLSDEAVCFHRIIIIVIMEKNFS